MGAQAIFNAVRAIEAGCSAADLEACNDANEDLKDSIEASKSVVENHMAAYKAA